MPYNPKSKKNLIPAKKGDVRNPEGKKKGTQSIKTILERFLKVDSGERHPETKETLTYYELAALKQLERAKAGDLASFKEIADRYEGQSKKIIETNLMTEDELNKRLKELMDET